ncbi:MAG: DUF5618 family protein [Bacteroidales bacterium]|nr:DUF5618 family protein [Bacteroidales bacterium]
MAPRKNPIAEAERYMENAKTILSEKGEKKDGYYHDPKYVRMAGNCAWNGVLLAIEASTDVRKNLKKGQRLDFFDYQKAVIKKDKKMNITLLSAYESLHKCLGYDGNPNCKIVQAALADGQKVIDWAKKHFSIPE